MAKKIGITYEPRTKVKRRRRPRPLNVRKKLGPRSNYRGMKSKLRGQG